MTIVVIKMITGEDIICDGTFEKDFVRLTKPAIIQVVMNQTGQTGLNLIPMCMFAENPNSMCIDLGYEKTMYSYEPSTDIHNLYVKNFGSGLLKAGPSVLLG